MSDSHKKVFHVKSINTFFRWSLFLFLLGATVVGPTLLIFNTPYYPAWSTLLIFYMAGGFVLVIWFVYSIWQTTVIRFFGDGSFSVKKVGQKATRHPFSAILAHNERPGLSQREPTSELTIYLSDDWFVIRSNEFRDYLYLKETFTKYGQAVPHRTVFTMAERNRVRWLLIGQCLLVTLNIAFGYLAHNPLVEAPAKLASFTNVVVRVQEDRNKSRLVGLTITLRSFPGYSFYVARRDYDVRLDTIGQAIRPYQPITLLVRQSDFRKKLVKKESLTFGDKYTHYNIIDVFGIEQENTVHLLSPRLGEVREPTHTNPIQRMFMLGFLQLLCWVGWVYVERQSVIGTE